MELTCKHRPYQRKKLFELKFHCSVSATFWQILAYQGSKLCTAHSSISSITSRLWFTGMHLTTVQIYI